MPRFAANLGYLFTERPLLERIDAAAAAGFKAVELQFPYNVPAAAVKAAIERNRLTILDSTRHPAAKANSDSRPCQGGRRIGSHCSRVRSTTRAQSARARFIVSPARLPPNNVRPPIAFSSKIWCTPPILLPPKKSSC